MEFAQTSRQPRVQPMVQSRIQPDIQTDHPDSLTGTHIPDPDSSLYALANLSIDLLNDIAHEGISTPVQYLNPDSQVPDVDVEVRPKKRTLYGIATSPQNHVNHHSQ